MYKAPQLRSTLRSCDAEQLHAVAARSTLPSQNVQCTPCSGHFWKLTRRKVHVFVARSTFPGQNVESTTCLDHLGSEVILRGRHKGFSATCQKWAIRESFVAFPETMAHVGHLNHLKRIWKDAFRMAGAVQKTCSSEMLGGQGTDFLRGVAFWSIRSSGLLRWFCVTGAVLRMTRHHFSWQAQYFSDIDRKNSKTHWYEAVSSALNFPCLEASQNCFVFDVVNLKTEEVSQNSFVFDVVKFKSWGSLAEVLRFWCCQIQKLKKSRRIASFWNLQIGFIEIDR